LKNEVEEKNLTMTFNARGFAPSYLAELLRDYTPVRALRSFDSLILAAPHFTVMNVGDRYFCATGPKICNFLPYSLRAGVSACTDATQYGFALLRCYILATYFDGLSSDFPSLPATTVVRSMTKCFGSPCGSVLAIKNPP